MDAGEFRMGHHRVLQLQVGAQSFGAGILLATPFTDISLG
jgi:hypothetical protein